MKFSDYYLIEKTQEKVKVFLGGTCGETAWRENLKPLFSSNVEYFDPVVKNWTKADQEKENKYKEICDVELYVITPAMRGVYSIAEIINACYTAKKVCFCILKEDKETHDGNLIHFNEAQMKSLQAVANMAKKLGCYICYNLNDVATFCNNYQFEENQINESLLDPSLFVAIASLGTAIFSILNAELVTQLVLKYGHKIINFLMTIEAKKREAEKIKNNKTEYEKMKESTYKHLIKTGVSEKEANLIIKSCFED